MTDAELYRFVSESQEEGFKALFMQYQAYVYKIVWGKIRSVGTAEDAEDCVSDVFLQVFLHFHEIQGNSLRAYIGTVAKHKAIDYARRLGTARGRMSGDEDISAELISDENVERSVEDTLESKRLLEKIRMLGEPDATILIGRYFYDQKPAAIAKGLGMTPVAVRVRLNRALRKLRKLLNDDDFSGTRR